MSTRGRKKRDDDGAPKTPQDPIAEEADRSQASQTADVNYFSGTGTLRAGTPEGGRPGQPTVEDVAPRVSADPFSTFLQNVAPAAPVPADVEVPVVPDAAPVAGAVASAALLALLQRLLQERATSRAAKERAAELDRKSVAILLYLADGQSHQTAEVMRSLKLSDVEVPEELQSLAGTDLVEITSGGDSLKLTPQGRWMFVQLSSEMAA